MTTVLRIQPSLPTPGVITLGLQREIWQHFPWKTSTSSSSSQFGSGGHNEALHTVREHIYIQSNPANITGLTDFILEGPAFYIRYGRISVTLWSVIAGRDGVL